MVRAEQTDGRQPMKWSSVDWTATEAVVGRIQERIFRAAKIKRPRLEPDDEQSSCPVLRGLGSGNGARLPDWATGFPARHCETPRTGHLQRCFLERGRRSDHDGEGSRVREPGPGVVAEAAAAASSPPLR